MYKSFLHILLFLLLCSNAIAQTTSIPDTNFRKYLKEKFPTYLNANGELVNARAATYMGGIDCSFRNISDLTGIEKFSNLTSLACYYNSISHLDSIAKLVNLNAIYCYNNRITHLPSLTSFTKLTYLSCGSNALTSLPDLSNNILLFYLDASNNQIQSIPGLDKLINLQTLFIFQNKLSSIPNLSKLTKLITFQCHMNQLRSLPGLGQLTQLTSLIAGANPYTQMEDLSALTKMQLLFLYNSQLTQAPNIASMTGLVFLDLNNNYIKALPSLEKNTKLLQLRVRDNLLDSLPSSISKLSLMQLHASGNKLTQLPDISLSKNSLTELVLNNNLLHTLPNLSSFSQLDSVFVHSNFLTFEDVLPLLNRSTPIRYVGYSPQNMVGKEQDSSLIQNQQFAYDLGMDKTIYTNTYTWFKNGIPYKTTPLDTLGFAAVQLGDSGVYTCQITNQAAPNLTLSSLPLRLKTKKCLDISAFRYASTLVQCNMGGSIKIEESSIKNAQPPYYYVLTSTENGKKHYTNENTFSNLFEISYQLEIKDANGCKTNYPIVLKGKNIKDCGSLVIVNDDYSVNNALFLEERGTAKIYDKTGQLVQTLSTPTAWDGKNQHGEFLPGYYVIDLNGTMLNVTLIK